MWHSTAADASKAGTPPCELCFLVHAQPLHLDHAALQLLQLQRRSLGISSCSRACSALGSQQVVLQVACQAVQQHLAGRCVAVGKVST